MTAEQQVQFAIRVEALHYTNYIAFTEKKKRIAEDFFGAKSVLSSEIRPSINAFAKYCEASDIAQEAYRECNIKRHQSQHFAN